MREVKPAKGVEGQIIHEGENVFFRVRGTRKTVDYKLTHLNLRVVVVDDDAAFYDGEYLDHGPDTLGVRVK